MGLSICYDVRFPELYRKLVDQGARIVTVPSAFTLTTGKDHWHALLRARAIENQVWVLAPAQHGKHPRGRQTYGKSLVVDPWGEVVAQCSEGEGMAVARLDFDYQDRVRTSLPVAPASQVVMRVPLVDLAAQEARGRGGGAGGHRRGGARGAVRARRARRGVRDMAGA